MQDQTRAEKFLKKVFPTPQQWWQRKPSLFKFSDQRVRDKLFKLMGTDVVKLSDRDYMKKLQNNRHKLYQKYLDKRIKDRMVWEVERKKNLILEGLVPISEGFQHLTEHPVFRITREVKSVIDERQGLITKKEKKKKKVPEFNYRLLEQDFDHLSTPSQVSIISEKDYFNPDVLEANREVVRETLVEEYEAGYMADRKTLEMFVYTPPEVKKLRDSTTVEEMYRAAEVVLRSFKEAQEEDQEGESNDHEIEATNAR